MYDASQTATSGLVAASQLPRQEEPPPPAVAPWKAANPVRTFLEWAPVPLLCKRFNVPNPYKGRSQPAVAQEFPRLDQVLGIQQDEEEGGGRGGLRAKVDNQGGFAV